MGLGFVFLGMNYSGRYRRNAYSCLAAAHHIPSVDVIPESITSCDDYVGRHKLGGEGGSVKWAVAVSADLFGEVEAVGALWCGEELTGAAVD
jgi:hypothetical protein